MQNSIEAFEASGIGLMAISVDPPGQAAQMRALHGITYPMLEDRGAEVIMQYDVFNPIANISKPAVFVLDPDGVVRWRQIGQNLADRAVTDDVLEAAIALIETGDPPPEPRSVSARGKTATTWARVKNGG